MTSLSGEPSAALEWFVRAQHLSPDRAFRVELTVDDRASYAIGSARADRFGVLAASGDEMLDPQRSLPCDGNGDGVFDYWLVTRDFIHLDGQPTRTTQ